MPAPGGLIIRAEEPGDWAAVRAVNEAAFGEPGEADLVESLRSEGCVIASLVAERDGQIAAHILFSRMAIDTGSGAVQAVALAPMAVLPQYQRQGIGDRLVRSGLDRLREQGERIVIVLGHPGYYPRFGFTVEKARNLKSPFPAEAYMAMELEPHALEGVHGTVRYAAAFAL